MKSARTVATKLTYSEFKNLEQLSYLMSEREFDRIEEFYKPISHLAIAQQTCLELKEITSSQDLFSRMGKISDTFPEDLLIKLSIALLKYSLGIEEIEIERDFKKEIDWLFLNKNQDLVFTDHEYKLLVQLLGSYYIRTENHLKIKELKSTVFHGEYFNLYDELYCQLANLKFKPNEEIVQILSESKYWIEKINLKEVTRYIGSEPIFDESYHLLNTPCAEWEMDLISVLLNSQDKKSIEHDIRWLIYQFAVTYTNKEDNPRDSAFLGITYLVTHHELYHLAPLLYDIYSHMPIIVWELILGDFANDLIGVAFTTLMTNNRSGILEMLIDYESLENIASNDWYSKSPMFDCLASAYMQYSGEENPYFEIINATLDYYESNPALAEHYSWFIDSLSRFKIQEFEERVKLAYKDGKMPFMIFDDYSVTLDDAPEKVISDVFETFKEIPSYIAILKSYSGNYTTKDRDAQNQRAYGVVDQREYGAVDQRVSYDDLTNDHSDFHAYPEVETFVRETKKVGRNEPCPCGSGKKYKKCCLPLGLYN